MNKWIESLSIQSKLVLLMVTICVTVLSASSLIFYINNIRIIENSLIKNTKTQAALVSDSVKSALIFNNASTANETIKKFERDPIIEFVAVILPDESIFAQYQKKSDTLTPKINVNRLWHISSEHIDVSYPVNNLHEHIGYIFIRSNLSELKSLKKEYARTLLGVLFFGLCLAYFLAKHTQELLTKPLIMMVNYVKELSTTNDYKKRLKFDQKNELGILLDGFHHLLDIVVNRESELKNHSENLQDLINQRTKELYKKSHFDSLTNLPNRALLLDRLDHAIKTAKRKQETLAILFLDLDRFKIINDTLGHEIGDKLLKKVAERLHKTGRENDTIARLGGDEFVFLIENITSPNDAAYLALRILKLFEKPFRLGENILHLSTSIGISLYPHDGDNAQLLLKNSDISMYHSKNSSPGSYTFYKDEINASSHERLTIENKLRNAIKNQEFNLLYQPQVDVKTNNINHVEALLRWTNADMGRIPPDVFIPIAEEMGMIKQIGMWVISETCRQVYEWENEGLNDLTVAVNISASHLIGDDLINHIKQETERHNITCDKIEIEITENVFLDHAEETINTLTKLQSLGIRISIDDFGTGYSSLRYLKNLPVDTLKLDGMFIKDLTRNSASLGIVSSTIILAHSLNMELVAECVETQEQLDILKEYNCDLIQGYFFYKPITAQEILEIKKIKI